MSQIRPNLVIIGAQKAGSTFLAQAIGHHPSVWMYPTEHAYFEDPDYDETPADAFYKLFERGRGKPVVGLKRPKYLPSPEVPPRIAADLPGVRLVAVLRDPVDRAFSAYHHAMRAGKLRVRPAEEAFADFADGRFSERWAFERPIIEWGFYARQLRRWTEQFGRDRMLVMTFDRLTRQTREAMHDVCSFLGIRTSKSSRASGVSTSPAGSGRARRRTHTRA